MALSSVLSTLLVLACAKASIAQTFTTYSSADADCDVEGKTFEATFNPVPTDFTACNPATSGAAWGAGAIVIQVVSTATEVTMRNWLGAACTGAAAGTTTFTPGNATLVYGGACAAGVGSTGTKEHFMITGVPASAWDKNKAAGATTTQGVATATTQGATSTATATTQGVATATTQGATSAATTTGANSTTGATGSTAGVAAPAVVASGAAQTSLAFLLIWAFAAVL